MWWCQIIDCLKSRRSSFCSLRDFEMALSDTEKTKLEIVLSFVTWKLATVHEIEKRSYPTKMAPKPWNLLASRQPCSQELSLGFLPQPKQDNAKKLAYTQPWYWSNKKLLSLNAVRQSIVNQRLILIVCFNSPRHSMCFTSHRRQFHNVWNCLRCAFSVTVFPVCFFCNSLYVAMEC